MELVIDIKNESLANKIIKLLEVFKSDGVEIRSIKGLDINENDTKEYDVDYENSLQCKLDRAEFMEMKEKL